MGDPDMSNTIRRYRGYEGELSVTAYVGPEWSKCVQLTVGREYVTLSEKQVNDLRRILSKRVNCVKGYSATDSIDEKTVTVDGAKE